VICSHCCDVVGAADGVEEGALDVGVYHQEERAEVSVDSDQPSVETSNLHFEYPATKGLQANGGVVDVLSAKCGPQIWPFSGIFAPRVMRASTML
jgi:hypothetical protein